VDQAAAAARRGPHLPPGEPGTPRLVERLDGGPAYYLVPWEVAQGAAGLVVIDAGTGGVLGVTLFQQPGPPPLLGQEEALAAAAEPGQTVARHRLVWQPSQESTSPVRPFYEIVWAGGGTAYVDMSGRRFEKLTPLGLGGGSR
jgi:hypothetical protein